MILLEKKKKYLKHTKGKIRGGIPKGGEKKGFYNLIISKNTITILLLLKCY